MTSLEQPSEDDRPPGRPLGPPGRDRQRGRSGVSRLFAVMALAMNVGAYYFSDRMVLRMHGAQEVDPSQAPQLHAMVRELAARRSSPCRASS